jgi:Integral membrane protein CcmA involved in cell shape determination
MALRSDDISINTIIGDGSSVTGNLHVNGFIRVDGDIDGNLETDGSIIIGEKARLRGNVKAKSVIIGGIVLGDIIAREGVTLLSSSAVVGDIISRKVQMEDSVVFHGYCISLENEEKFASESERFLQAKAIRNKASLA